jgi:8-oxo-dGTP diphosphatase
MNGPKPGREYPDRPISGVGVVVLRDNEVLMIKRGREPRIGQ